MIKKNITMDQNATSKSFDLLAGRLLRLESQMKEGFESLLEKLHPQSKKYLTDKDLLEEFQITRAVKDKLITKGVLNPIKLNGSRSTSLYIREEVEKALEENGRIYPKS